MRSRGHRYCGAVDTLGTAETVEFVGAVDLEGCTSCRGFRPSLMPFLLVVVLYLWCLLLLFLLPLLCGPAGL